ncbi:MAG: type ISP restriction/modification enzyme, partial [Chitinophagales bacterium]
MTIQSYLENINQKFKLGNATEHTFRGLLEQLIESIVPDIRATNEPKRQSCGAPDYILTRGDIPVGFIEAKDIGDKDLKGEKKTGNKEQFDRYKASLPNLIFTDYLDFHLYREGKFVTSISIGELTDKGVLARAENFIAFENLIKDFCVHISQTIKSSKQLAEMMAGKARLLSDVIGRALVSDEINHENSTLKDQMKAFKDILIHDITPQGFADVYAQTIVYGMFCARLHDPTLPTFSRQEAYELIPKSNPFLKKLFGYIAGLDLDDRIVWIVESLVELFLACNVEELLKNYGKQTKMENPIIHFYEDFLSEYDPKLRKARGVWYTPAPVVNFIVRAVDDILKSEFNLPQGLAETSKTTIKVQAQGTNNPIEQEVHKVQILDPATGTGTFLAEVIRHIHKRFEGQQGIWTNYVEQHLIPRLNGFELLMASYAMAHLQLDLLLTETGFKPSTNQRIRVFLTNSLEESHPDTGTLFANWLSTEANEANQIKRDTPVMCVIGNPPYSGISSNNGQWISKLIDDYKYVDGVHFNERKHWLNDDYVKFIRYGQHFIEKNGSGVLAFINPHGFLDNLTFRGMRWHLLKTFDKIYTIDLHGNSKKKETAPDGSADVNVFDIMQGVSINIFIKSGKKKTNELGKVFHYDIFGKRDLKYNFLSEKSLKDIVFQELKPEQPFLFFIPKNNEGFDEYDKGFRVDALFPKNVTGIVTMGDSFIVEEKLSILKERLNSFISKEMSEDFLNKEFGLGKNYAEWILNNKSSIKIEESKFAKISYRLFDDRYTYFDNKLLWRWRVDVMQHFLKGENIGIDLCRQIVSDSYSHIFITNKIVDDSFVSNKSRERGYVYPLYLYPDSSTNDAFQSNERRPNLNIEIVQQIADKLGLTFTNEKETTKDTFAPIDILDYIYAVLHSPTYREKYKEF